MIIYFSLQGAHVRVLRTPASVGTGVHTPVSSMAITELPILPRTKYGYIYGSLGVLTHTATSGEIDINNLPATPTHRIIIGEKPGGILVATGMVGEQVNDIVLRFITALTPDPSLPIQYNYRN